MGITVSSASGIAIDNSISDYSYSEEANSIEPSSLNGGSGAATVTLDAEDFSVSTGTSYIGSDMTLTDGPGNSVQFKTTSIAKNTSGMVTITGDTLTAKMNVEVTANPQVNTPLKTAINYYCSLAGVTPQYDASITSDLGRTVNFIGWKGNLWEHLKMLCAGVMSTSGANIEMYVLNGVLRFRKALDSANLIDLTNEVVSQDISFDSSNLAQSIEINNYKTSYGSNKIMFELNQSESKPTNGAVAIHPATTGVITVNAGETVVKRIKVNASLTSIDQPEAALTMGIPPYNGTVSKYVVCGTDDLVIDPAQWEAGGPPGGRVQVAIVGDAKDEVEITIVAPPKPASSTPGSPGGGGGTPAAPVTSLSAPTGLTATVVVGSNYNFAWSAVTGAEYYELVVDPTNPDGTPVTYVAGGNNYNKTLATSTTYLVKVRAITDHGGTTGDQQIISAYSTSISVTVGGGVAIQGGGTNTSGGSVGVATIGGGASFIGNLIGEVGIPDVPGAPEDGTGTDSNSDTTTLGFDSYKIGIETAGDGSDYPAFYLVGTGVFYDKTKSTLSTGLSSSVTTNVVGATIDNPFITNTSDLNAKGALAVDRFKYPRVTMSQSVDSPRTFGTLPGSTQVVDGATFRVESVSYSPSSVSINSVKV